jgi:energy-coupling factor transport system ATP-binding protein
VVVAGPSGCGKSTLLRCINGIYPHLGGGSMSGEVLLDGVRVTRDPPEKRCARIGTVFQDFEAQIVHLTVEDELAFGPENMALCREEIGRRIARVLPVIGLPPGADTGRLSGGQKQRLCVGGALACEPDLVLLDEPLSNLDAESARGLVEFLRRVKREGRAVLVVEHRLDLVSGCADRVLWMEGGRLSAAVPPATPVPDGARKPHDYGPGSGAVTINGLSYAYRKGEPVFNGLSMEVMQGEMAVLLGRNGSGKSTLLKVLAGLLPVQQGDVSIMGEPARRKPPSFFRRNVGLVTQNPNHQLFMDSVYNEVYMSCMDPAAADRVLEVFGLSHLRDRHPYSLSEGEKRRTALAAVVASGPRVLLLDEPTLGQDRQSLIRMVEALRRYSREKMVTVITVTHEETAAKALGERAFRFADGSLTEVDRPGGNANDSAWKKPGGTGSPGPHS